jgi:hypothetical protein
VASFSLYPCPLRGAPNSATPQPPAAAPAPAQPAATINQSNPFNSATNMNTANAANRSGVYALARWPALTFRMMYSPWKRGPHPVNAWGTPAGAA